MPTYHSASRLAGRCESIAEGAARNTVIKNYGAAIEFVRELESTAALLVERLLEDRDSAEEGGK